MNPIIIYDSINSQKNYKDIKCKIKLMLLLVEVEYDQPPLTTLNFATDTDY